MNDKVQKQIEMTDEEIEQGVLATLHEEYIELEPQAELPEKPIPSIEAIDLVLHEMAETKKLSLPVELSMVERSPALMNMAQRLLLWSLVYGLAPKRYLEIGTAAGGSATIVASAIKALAQNEFKAVCIDPKFELSDETRAYLGESFTYIESKNAPEVLIEATKQAGGLFDLILIDGDHRYDYALSDILLTVPYLAKGGYLLIDDASHVQVREAIRYVLDRAGLTDCGLMCRHAVKMSFAPVIESGHWQGEKPLVGGMYVLYKPF